MKKRTNISSNAPWEKIASYSRAVRIGDQIEVSGTTSVKDGRICFPGDAAAQTKVILEIIKKSLKDCGAEMKDIVRTRIYVTNIRDWEKVVKIHGECFADIMPATTLVEVSSLIDPDMLVEIEATAIISNE